MIYLKPKPSYSLYRPRGHWDNREYTIVIFKDGKRYGYKKLWNERQAKYQHNPNTDGMEFVGYLKEDTAEKMLFIDLL